MIPSIQQCLVLLDEKATSKSLGEYEPAFYVPPSGALFHSKTCPPTKASCTQVDKNAFAKKHGFTWSDGFSIPSTLRDAVFKALGSTQYSEQCRNSMLQSLDAFSFAIADSGDDTIGQLAFLAPDSKPIPAGTAFLYAGRLASGIDHLGTAINDTYRMSVADEQWCCARQLLRTCVDALHSGNQTRFFSDSPDLNEIEQIKIAPALLSKIAVANFAQFSFIFSGFPVEVLIAITDIAPGDLCCISYGPDFWNNVSTQRALLDYQGQIIGHFSTEKSGEIVLRKDYRLPAGQAPQFTLQVARAAITAWQTALAPDIKTLRAQLMQQLIFVLQLYQHRYEEEGGDTLAKINTMLAIMSSEDTFADKYKKLQTQLTSITKDDALFLMKKEMIIYTKHYNAASNKALQVGASSSSKASAMPPNPTQGARG